MVAAADIAINAGQAVIHAAPQAQPRLGFELMDSLKICYSLN